MFVDEVEVLKKKWTDKYVLVDEARPELRRFKGLTGTVRTVNFSGRALVEFDGNNNTGWFDIDPRFLKVIDAPLPKVEKKEVKAEKKPAPAKEAAPKAEAAKPTAKPAAAGSVADVLAAARAGKKPEAEAKPAAPAAKMSVAEMMAAARGQKAPAAAPAAPPPIVEAPKAVVPEPEPEPEPEPVVEAPAAKSGGAKDKNKMSISEIVAYCRQVDTKG